MTTLPLPVLLILSKWFSSWSHPTASMEFETLAICIREPDNKETGDKEWWHSFFLYELLRTPVQHSLWQLATWLPPVATAGYKTGHPSLLVHLHSSSWEEVRIDIFTLRVYNPKGKLSKGTYVRSNYTGNNRPVSSFYHSKNELRTQRVIHSSYKSWY